MTYLWYSQQKNKYPLCISVLRVAAGPRVKLASCKSALNPSPRPPVVYSTFLLPFFFGTISVVDIRDNRLWYAYSAKTYGKINYK